MSKNRPRKTPPPLPPLSAPETTTNNARRSMLLVTVIGAVLLVVFGGVAAIFLTQGNGPDKFGDVVSGGKSKDLPARDPELGRLERERQARLAGEERQKQEQLAREKAEADKNAEPDRIAKTEAAKKDMERAVAEAQRKLAEEQRLEAIREEGPFTFIKASVNAQDCQWHDEHGQWLFELPKPRSGEKAKSLPLKASGMPIKLRLFPGANDVLGNHAYALTLEQDPGNPTSWNLVSKQGGRSMPLGVYSLAKLDTKGDPAKPDTQLQFEWLQEASRETLYCELARWWPLEIEGEDGNQRAVLLQRRAFVPQSVPGNDQVLRGQEFYFSASEELKSLGQRQADGIQFLMELQQPGQAVQVIQFNMPEKNNAEFDSDMWEPRTNRTFFPLTTPVVFTSEIPEVSEIGVGMARLEVTPTFSDTGITLQTAVEARVRLPTQEHVAALPTVETNELLKKAAECRTLEDFQRVLGTFNPALKGRELTQLKTETESYFSELDRWYMQPLSKKLPSKAAWKVPFYALKDKACDAAKPLSQLKDPGFGGSEGINRQYQALTGFVPAMNETEDALKDSVAQLMKDYDQVQIQLQAVDGALRSSQFRFQLTSRIETPGAINGESLTLYFLDTGSPNARGGVKP